MPTSENSKTETHAPRRFNPLFWRKWHRWIGFPAALFLIFAATTGFLVAFTEFFGEEESLREATRDLVSPVTVSSAQAMWSDPIAKAIVATANATTANSPIDKIEIQFKGAQPTVTVFTGKPTGGEDRKLVIDAKTGALIKNEDYADKPFLYRLHSGEAFGDGGLVFAMFWALALAVLASSGLIIYYTMRGKRVLTGTKKVFW
ncbi:MAG: PepSY-associated TM helix domain-containing protein [Gemmatimonadaceae bacterium]